MPLMPEEMPRELKDQVLLQHQRQSSSASSSLPAASASEDDGLPPLIPINNDEETMMKHDDDDEDDDEVEENDDNGRGQGWREWISGYASWAWAGVKSAKLRSCGFRHIQSQRDGDGQCQNGIYWCSCFVE